MAGCDEDDLYAAMDCVLARKDSIERSLAARHLSNATLMLYDVSSAAFESRTCPLRAISTPATSQEPLQIVYALLCSTADVPVAIEVFDSNTADPKTLSLPDHQAQGPFELTRVCLSVIAAC